MKKAVKGAIIIVVSIVAFYGIMGLLLYS